MEKLVTCIITTYGREYSSILPAIKSVLNQTYQKLEIILVDDNGEGSENQKKIEKAVTELDEERFQYIANKRNSGAQISRNIGIINSTGEFIAFLDDDDLWESEKIELQLKEFENERIDLVFSQGWDVTLDKDGNLVSKKPYNMSKNLLRDIKFEDISYGDYIGTTSQVLIRKSVFAKVGVFDVNQPARQDYEMWIRICQNSHAIGVEKFLFQHFHHFGEQISKDNNKAILGLENIYRKYNDKMSYTARWHIMWLIVKALLINKNYGKFILKLFTMIKNYIFCRLFDNKEYKYRVKLHRMRVR